MKISLPDVNTLLALVVAGHVHHVPAREWFATQENDAVAICRVTQMGLLRLLTNPRVPPARPCSAQRAFAIWHELRADKSVFFEYEPPGLETAWAALMQHPAVGGSSWTDACLAAFAQQHNYEIATFDRGFQRWPDLKLSLLPQSAM